MYFDYSPTVYAAADDDGSGTTLNLSSTVKISMRVLGATSSSDITLSSGKVVSGIRMLSSQMQTEVSLASRLIGSLRVIGSLLVQDQSLSSILRSIHRISGAAVISDIALVSSKILAHGRMIGSSLSFGDLLELSSTVRLHGRLTGTAASLETQLFSHTRLSSRMVGAINQSVNLIAAPIVITNRQTGAQITMLIALQLSSTHRSSGRVVGSRIDSSVDLTSKIRQSMRIPGALMNQLIELRNSTVRQGLRFKSSQVLLGLDLQSGQIRAFLRIPGSTYTDSTGVATFGLVPLDAFFDTFESLADFDDDVESDLLFDDNTTADWE